MRKKLACIFCAALLLGAFPATVSAAPQEASVQVDCAKSQGELFRMEQYNNLSGVNTYSLKPEEDITFMKENGLSTKIIRVWVSESYFDLSSGQLDQAEMAKYTEYLKWASALSDSILINITGGSYLSSKASDADIQRSLKAILKWFKDNYPKVEYIECLNEPDNVASIKDTPHEYYRYYKNFYKTVNELNAENKYAVPLKVGGPTIMSYRYEPGKTWLPAFIQDYAADPDPEKKLDFISYHVYSYPDDPSLIAGLRPEIEGFLKDAGLPADIPSFITESGLYPGAKEDLSVGEDQMIMAAGMLAYNYYWMESPHNVPFQWVLRHSSQERKDQLVTRPDYPTGKFTMYGNVMSMMSKMKTTRVAADFGKLDKGFGVYGLASADNSGVSAAVWNYQRKNKTSYETKVDFQNLPAAFNGKNIKVKKYVVDYGNGNFYFDREHCNLKVHSEIVYPNDPSFSSFIYLAPNACAMLVLEPTDDPITETGAPISIYINDIEYPSDAAPVELNGRTLVPVRLISEALGCNVSWNDGTQTATITRGNQTIVLTAGQTNASVNGTQTILDVPAQLIHDRTMVPVRFVSEALECSVDWAENSRSVLITSSLAKTYSDLCDNIPVEEGPVPAVLGQYPPVSAAATVSQSGHEASHAIDYTSNKTYWSSGNIESGATLTVDFGQTVKLDGAFAAFTNGRDSISSFDLAVSADGVNFTTVAAGLQSSGKTLDPQTFAFSQSVQARYLSYIGKGNTLDQDNSLTAFGGYGLSGTKYEAEEASSTHTVTVIASSDYDSSGGKLADYGDAGSYIEWNNVNAQASGTYTMSVVYAIASEKSRDCKITVNGVEVGTLSCPGTKTWDNWQTAVIQVPLQAGANTIRITSIAAGPNIDYMMMQDAE